MTEMSMNRAIHGAFRRDLDRFVAALRAFPPGDLTRARQLGTAWENFEDQLTDHHEGEHSIAWPALRAVGVSEELLATMDAEHESMAASLAETRSAIGALTQAAGVEEVRAALVAFQKLQAVTVAHLDHEEAEIEDVYLAKRDTAEMKAMGRAFGRVSPFRGGRFFAWLLDGASREEREAVTREVPGPVVSVIGGPSDVAIARTSHRSGGARRERDTPTSWSGSQSSGSGSRHGGHNSAGESSHVWSHPASSHLVAVAAGAGWRATVLPTEDDALVTLSA